MTMFEYLIGMSESEMIRLTAAKDGLTDEQMFMLIALAEMDEK